MRTFAMLILALNLVYLVWSETRGPDSVDEGPPVQGLFVQADRSLVMLSERPPPSLPLQEQESISEPGAQIPALSGQTVDRQESPPASPAETGLSQAWCGVVSGFDDQTDATEFVTEISEMDIVASLDVQQEQISSTWWVHLPPFKSQVEAQSVIEELTAKGIENFYMRTGDLAGGISLGVFSRQQRAQIAQAEFLDRGYQTSIAEIPRYLSKAYVTMEASDPALLETAEWRAFLATKTKLEVTEKLCETIAR